MPSKGSAPRRHKEGFFLIESNHPDEAGIMGPFATFREAFEMRKLMAQMFDTAGWLYAHITTRRTLARQSDAWGRMICARIQGEFDEVGGRAHDGVRLRDDGNST